MFVRGRVGAAAQRGREVALREPAALPLVARLVRRQMADRECRHVPGVVLEEQLDALVVHDVAVLDAVRPEPNRVLHGLGIGRVRHHPELALAADGERRLQLVLQQERVPVAVPGGTHDAAREVHLDVIDAVLDLLADRFHEAVGAVAFERMTRSEEVPAGRREEMAAREEARTRRTARNRTRASRQRP